MEFQVWQFVLGSAVGGFGTYLAIRRDIRDVDAREMAKETAREQRLIETMTKAVSSEVRVIEQKYSHMQSLMEITRDSVGLLNNTIENKLATKQDMFARDCRIEALEMRATAFDRELREMRRWCDVHEAKGTTSIPRTQ